MPHEISTSLRLNLAGPTPLRGGATQKCGRSPHFVCPSPTRVGAAEVEVMGGDDLLGQRNGPSLSDSLLVGSYIFLFFFFQNCERNVHFKGNFILYVPPFHNICPLFHNICPGLFRVRNNRQHQFNNTANRHEYAQHDTTTRMAL